MNKEKILAVLVKYNLLTPVYLMGINNNLTLCRLSEYSLQLNNRKTAGFYDVFKHISRTDTWKLVHITYKNQFRSNRNSFKE